MATDRDGLELGNEYWKEMVGKVAWRRKTGKLSRGKNDEIVGNLVFT